MGGGGVFPHMGYIGMCSPKEYSFSAVLVLNRVLFLHSYLKLVVSLNKATFSSLSIRPSTKVWRGSRFLRDRIPRNGADEGDAPVGGSGGFPPGKFLNFECFNISFILR